jgi:hypothetical protein
MGKQGADPAAHKQTGGDDRSGSKVDIAVTVVLDSRGEPNGWQEKAPKLIPESGRPTALISRPTRVAALSTTRVPSFWSSATAWRETRLP